MSSPPWFDKLVKSAIEIGPIAPHCLINICLYPLARFFLPRFKSRNFQALFHGLVGCALAYILFLNRIIVPIAATVVFYFLIDLNPIICAICALILDEGVNLYIKLRRPTAWEYELSCIIMIQFQKIISISMNLYAGRQIKADKAKGWLTRPYAKRLALDKKPRFIDWFAYMMTLFGAASGPAFEYKLFDYMLEVGNHERTKPDSKSRKRATLRWCSAIFWDIFNLLFMKYGAITFYDSEFYTSKPVFVRSLLCIVCTMVQCVRYFPAWHPVDAADYEMGIAETDLVDDFEDISNMGLWQLLQSPSVGVWLGNWNHSAHIFWKRYLFYPLKDNGVPYSIAHHSTFLASAVWHGFQPVFFLCLPEMMAASVADGIIIKYWPAEKRNLIGNILYHYWKVMTMMNATSTWWYRSSEAFWKVRASHNYSMSIMTFGVFIVMWIYSKIRPLPKSAQQTAKKQ